MLKRYLIIFILLFSCSKVQAQLTGGLESDAAYYLNDNKIKLNPMDAQHRFRSNNYLRLDYRLNQFSAGFQLESYDPEALLNYAPVLKNTSLGTYYFEYKNNKIGLEAIAGHFYEQFGSGLILRTWEDRSLGIANSIAGARIKYSPNSFIHFTLLYGKQRNGLGFNFTNGILSGINAEFQLSSLLKVKKLRFGIGLSLLNRNENDTSSFNLNNNTHLTSFRGYISSGGFSADGEYVNKSPDALVEFNRIESQYQFNGSAYLLNLNYSKNGFGITSNLRRLENFIFFCQLNLAGNV